MTDLRGIPDPQDGRMYQQLWTRADLRCSGRKFGILTDTDRTYGYGQDYVHDPVLNVCVYTHAIQTEERTNDVPMGDQ